MKNNFMLGLSQKSQHGFDLLVSLIINDHIFQIQTGWKVLVTNVRHRMVLRTVCL